MVKESKASLQSIADEAGVSIVSVSQALRGVGRLAPETRSRILEIAKRLKYRPNQLVLSLREGKTKSVGVLAPQHCSFHSMILRGMLEGLADEGYVAVMPPLQPSQSVDIFEFEARQLYMLLDRRVDGLLLISSILKYDEGNVFMKELRERDIPLVVVDRPVPGLKGDFAGVDDVSGGRLAARHLLELGHRELAVLAVSYPGVSDARAAGFIEEASRVGARCSLLRADGYKFEDALPPLSGALASSNRPTGLFCVSDYLALGAYRVASNSGLSIPRDLSIVGFGDVYEAGFALPPLTTLNQDVREEGRMASRLLLDRIAGKLPAAFQTRLVSPRLSINGSTSPLSL